MNAQGKATKPRQPARQTEKAPPAKRSKVARDPEDSGAKETVAEKDKVSRVLLSALLLSILLLWSSTSRVDSCCDNVFLFAQTTRNGDGE